MDGKNGVRILLIEDNPADARLVAEVLKDAVGDRSTFACEIVHASNMGDALSLVGDGGVDVILTDLDLPDSRGLETFDAIRAEARGIPVVVLTGLADEEMGVRAVKAGAQDYLIKGQVDGDILLRAVRFAIERHGTSAWKDRSPDREAAREGHFPHLEMIGASPRFKEVLDLISIVARTSRTSVLIHGETGTGKELIANAVHYLSSRRDGPFIKLNCSAIPDTLLETEMFGYEKGAFTDAKQTKSGLFELADGGTLFLDEIGDMDIRLQPKLLQVLENRTFRRVGGVRDITVDVRVIAATNKDLGAMVRERRFREDLFYRLNVMVINSPPLRDRKEDIIVLAARFLKENSLDHGVRNKRLSLESKESLLKYHWPGNVRELKNAVERAFLMAGNTDEILPAHLPTELLAGPMPPASQEPFSSENITLKELERTYIQHVLDRAGGNKTRAAEALGISRQTLREKLKKSGIQGS